MDLHWGSLSFPFSLSLKPGPARVSLGCRTSTDALEPASGYRVRVLASFHEKQSYGFDALGEAGSECVGNILVHIFHFKRQA